MAKLYRHYDRYGTLLYVGVSLSAIERLRGHRGVSPWFDQITRVEIQTFRTRREALDAEREAIRKEEPLHNVMSARKPQDILLGLFKAPDITQAHALQLGQSRFHELVSIAQAIPGEITAKGQAYYRRELIRRLVLRGWTFIRGVLLENGSRGDDTYHRARLDTVVYPPPPAAETSEIHSISDYPILVEIERNMVSHRTRAKLLAYGQRPHRGILVIVLYGKRHSPRTCPEATKTICLHQVADLTKSRHERMVGLR